MAGQERDIHAIIRSAAKRHGLFAPGVLRVALAVSGGADSVCLLHALAQLHDEFGISLGVAHLNHGVRGAHADADQAFVCNFAHHYGFEFYTEKIDVPSLVEPGGPSLEQVCREQRMDFYKRALKHLGAQRIATGHTLSDQAETMLMRVLRGTSLRGLAAMDFVNGNIIRPLLAAPRELVREYVRENGLEFHEDATNADVHYTRNRVRQTLMPVLKEIFNPQAEQRLFSLSQLLRTDLDFLEDQAELAYHKARTARIGNEIHLDLNELAQLHDAILSRVLIMAYYKMDSAGPARSLQQGHVLDMMHAVREGGTGHVVALPGNLCFEKHYEKIVFKPIEEQKGQAGFEYQLEPDMLPKLMGAGEKNTACFKFDPPGIVIEMKIMDKLDSSISNNSDEHSAYFDAHKISGSIIVRSPRPGDRFIPLGMNHEKKLQDFFVDQKIPFAERQSIPVFTAGNDIMWVAGYRISNRYKVDANTNKVLAIRISGPSGN
jgi:tRNA(Ile)-lysidine synthase